MMRDIKGQVRKSNTNLPEGEEKEEEGQEIEK